MAEDPIEEEFKAFMNALAGGIDDALEKQFGRNIGFALFMFEFGDFTGGRVNYISNAQRDDMVAAMKEWIARHEGRYIEEDTTKKPS